MIYNYRIVVRRVLIIRRFFFFLFYLFEIMVLTKPIVVNVSNICKSNHHVIHFKLVQ